MNADLRAELLDLLTELAEYMDQRADCDFDGDPLEPRPNKEMGLLCAIQETMEKL